jgi:membrane protein YqaA with SNARE-associated domain
MTTLDRTRLIGLLTNSFSFAGRCEMLSAESLLEYGPLGLFLVAFFESTVFPIPPDVLLLPLCLMNPRLSWWYAFLTTAASTLGAFLGYAVGRKAGRPVVERFFASEMVEKVQFLFGQYGGWAVGIAAFTPVPYKVFTIGAGVFRVPFMTFTVASVIGRASRFFLEGAMVYFLGERARTYLGRNFEIATLAITALLLAAVAAYPKTDAYLRRSRVLDRPFFRRLSGIVSSAGMRLRSVRPLGVRFFGGLSASAVLFLLVVVFLGDLAGPERVALNRSLTPVYERLSGSIGVAQEAKHWGVLSSPLVWASLSGAGALRWIAWDLRDRRRDTSGRSGGHRGATTRITSGIFRSLTRVGFLAAGAYISEVVFSGYVRRVYGTSLWLPAGHAFLTPYFLVFGAYLVSKGISKLLQVPLLGLAAVLAVGNLAYLVKSCRFDAAVATASLTVSSLMLAVSYTLLLVRKKGA